MRRSLFSSYITKKNIAIVFILVLIVIGGYILYLDFISSDVTITPLRSELGHYEHSTDYWEDYYEYKVFADIKLPANAKGYKCICSFYDKEDNTILNQSKISLDNYTSSNANKNPIGLVRWHMYHNISKVEISVLNKGGNILAHTDYKWHNPKSIKNITDSAYSDYF